MEKIYVTYIALNLNRICQGECKIVGTNTKNGLDQYIIRRKGNDTIHYIVDNQINSLEHLDDGLIFLDRLFIFSSDIIGGSKLMVEMLNILKIRWLANQVNSDINSREYTKSMAMVNKINNILKNHLQR